MSRAEESVFLTIAILSASVVTGVLAFETVGHWWIGIPNGSFWGAVWWLYQGRVIK